MMINKIITFQINVMYYCLNFDQHWPSYSENRIADGLCSVRNIGYSHVQYQHYRRIMVFPITATVLFSVRYELIVL